MKIKIRKPRKFLLSHRQAWGLLLVFYVFIGFLHVLDGGFRTETMALGAAKAQLPDKTKSPAKNSSVKNLKKSPSGVIRAPQRKVTRELKPIPIKNRSLKKLPISPKNVNQVAPKRPDSPASQSASKPGVRVEKGVERKVAPRATELPRVNGPQKFLENLEQRVPYLSHWVRGLLGLLLLFAFFLWLTERRNQNPIRIPPKSTTFRQLRGKAPRGVIQINPADFDGSNTILNESARAIIHSAMIPPSAVQPLPPEESGQEEVDVLAPDNAKTRAMIRRSLDQVIHHRREHEKNSSSEANNAALAPGQRKIPPLRFPPPMQGYFKGLAEEYLMWNGPLAVSFLVDGWLSLTNQRLLMVFESNHLKLSEKPFDSKTKQILLQSVQDVQLARVRHPIFLVLSLVFLLFYPLGSIVALLNLGAFFIGNIRVLRVFTPEDSFDLPVSKLDLEVAKLKITKAVQEAREAQKQEELHHNYAS